METPLEKWGKQPGLDSATKLSILHYVHTFGNGLLHSFQQDFTCNGTHLNNGREWEFLQETYWYVTFVLPYKYHPL